MSIKKGVLVIFPIFYFTLKSQKLYVIIKNFSLWNKKKTIHLNYSHLSPMFITCLGKYFRHVKCYLLS